MRVLQVSGTYAPLIGGLERAVETTAQALGAKGHEVEVATLAHAAPPSEELEDGVRVTRLDGWNRILSMVYERPDRLFAPPAPDPGAVAGLRRILRRFRPEVVHAHDWMYYSAAVAARSLGIPIVLTLHDHGLVCVKRSFMYGSTTCSGPRPMKCVACARVEYGVAKAATLKTGHMVSAPLLRAAAMLLPVSSAVRDIAIRASRLPAEKFMVLPAPLPDFVGDAELSAPQFLADVPPFILYVGALSRHKGVDVLLDAYAQLSDPPPLVLLGTPQPNQGLRFPAGVLVHENVDYLDVLASYDRALCTVVPSVWDEPLSSVPREALLRRCAIVVSDGGALPEIAGHGEAGLVAARGDASALAEAIASMVAKPELRRQLALRGRDRAERYFASRIAEELEAVYEVVRADAARQRR